MPKKKREPTGVELLDDFGDVLDAIPPVRLRNVIHCAARVELACRWNLAAKDLLRRVRAAIDEAGGDMGQHPQLIDQIDRALSD